MIIIGAITIVITITILLLLLLSLLENTILQDELKHTHKTLRHVHNLLQLKTEANLNIMKETSILQTTYCELRMNYILPDKR